LGIAYFHVDAFTGRLFAGNPAGVCLLTRWLPDATLLAIAAENNLAETAFVVRSGPSCELRWFTPKLEVDLCGHATLAAAHVLFHHDGWSEPAIGFATRQAGALTVRRQDARLVLDFPSRPASPCPPPPELVQALGREPAHVARARDYLAVFEHEDDVLALTPDLAMLRRLDALGVIVTAPGRDCDFVSRFFAPAAGIDEDPVTGSAHCTLIPYWSARLGRRSLHARQRSARGGELFCTDRGERVDIAGHAVTYSAGTIHV
jgi:PhzF family phenazine biosynthesis protein